MTLDFNFSQLRNFSTLIFWLWFFRLQLLNFVFDFLLQWSFNTTMGHSIHSRKLLDFGFFRLWYFWLWYFDFDFSDFNFWNFVFDFLLQWSFNTTICHSIHSRRRLSFWTRFWTLDFSDFDIFDFDILTLIFWTLIFQTSTLEISFLIFFFNDHSIWVLLWIIQYIDTAAAAAAADNTCTILEWTYCTILEWTHCTIHEWTHCIILKWTHCTIVEWTHCMINTWVDPLHDQYLSRPTARSILE